MMVTIPQSEQPGFETDVNELPEGRDSRAEDTLEEQAMPDHSHGRVSSAFRKRTPKIARAAGISMPSETQRQPMPGPAILV